MLTDIYPKPDNRLHLFFNNQITKAVRLLTSFCLRPRLHQGSAAARSVCYSKTVSVHVNFMQAV